MSPDEACDAMMSDATTQLNTATPEVITVTPIGCITALLAFLVVLYVGALAVITVRAFLCPKQYLFPRPRIQIPPPLDSTLSEPTTLQFHGIAPPLPCHSFDK